MLESIASDACKAYRHDRVLHEDLVQEALCCTLALIKDLEERDKEINVDYIKKALRRPITTLFMRSKTPFSLPFNNAFNASVSYISKNNITSSDKEVWKVHAKKLGVSLKIFESAYYFLNPAPVPLSTISEDGIDGANGISRKILLESVMTATNNLEDVEATIIDGRYLDSKKRSYAEIGNSLSCSHTAVRKKEKAIVSSLRKLLLADCTAQEALDAF